METLLLLVQNMAHKPGVKMRFLKQEWLLGDITASSCSWAAPGLPALGLLPPVAQLSCPVVLLVTACAFLQISAPPCLLPRSHG